MPKYRRDFVSKDDYSSWTLPSHIMSAQWDSVRLLADRCGAEWWPRRFEIAIENHGLECIASMSPDRTKAELSRLDDLEFERLALQSGISGLVIFPSYVWDLSRELSRHVVIEPTSIRLPHSRSKLNYRCNLFQPVGSWTWIANDPLSLQYQAQLTIPSANLRQPTNEALVEALCSYRKHSARIEIAYRSTRTKG